MKKRLNCLLVTLDGGGNIPPMLGLARRLLQRGHVVTILAEPCLGDAITDIGCGLISFKRHFTRQNRKEDLIRDWNASPLNDPTMDNIVFGPAKIVVEESLEVIEKKSIDVLIADCLLPTALMAAEIKGIPAVCVFHFPEYMPGPNRPPGVLGLIPGKGWMGKLRDQLLAKVFYRLLNKYKPRINEIRSNYGLELYKNVTDMVDRADLRLIQTLKTFDFPIDPSPSNVRYTGPVLDDPDWTKNWTNPWPEDDKRPLIVISLSSTFQNQHQVIQTAMDGLKGLAVRGLVTLGPAMEEDQFDCPENVVVLKSAPHSKVFPLADLVITHAGHGTLMRALSNGLPLICLPMGRDQNDNAAKVAYHGCGIRLSSKTSTIKIRKAVLNILEDRKYRDSARRFMDQITSNSALEEVILEIETIAALPGGNTPPVEKQKEAEVRPA